MLDGNKCGFNEEMMVGQIFLKEAPQILEERGNQCISFEGDSGNEKKPKLLFY